MDARLRHEIIEDRLTSPLLVSEAARILGVSRPTVLKWASAGLLPEAEGSRPHRRFLDVEAVFLARRTLRKVQQQSTRRHGGDWFQRLVERLFWETHPGDRGDLLRSLNQVDHGQVSEFHSELLDEVRQARQQKDRHSPVRIARSPTSALGPQTSRRRATGKLKSAPKRSLVSRVARLAHTRISAAVGPN
jgi:excisionase family DNA binding protein